jgi:hypothetical protein
VEDGERYRERIRSYSESILSAINEGISANETPETIAAQRFRKIPLPFRADTATLIDMQSRVHKT